MSPQPPPPRHPQQPASSPPSPRGESSRRLGRGLGALLTPAGSPAVSGESRVRDADIQRIPIAHIRPNPFQPRKEFNSDQLAELAASLKVSGLLQPVTIRRARPVAIEPSVGSSGNLSVAGAIRADRYELLAGERRLRAAAHLGWTEIPAVIRDVDDQTALTLALVENLQRSDLNPIEEAEGYAQLIQQFSLTQQEIAEAVGKERSTVANLLRLLNLPPAVRAMVRDGKLTLGHARALLALGSEREITAAANNATTRGLTVRQVEELGRSNIKPVKRQKRATKASFNGNSSAKEIQDRLRRYLQTDVTLSLTGQEQGQISILFYSNDDLERILELVLRRTAGRDAL
jgi:ParB family transcriptional regulator, chromosome partitioning protein